MAAADLLTAIARQAGDLEAHRRGPILRGDCDQCGEAVIAVRLIPTGWHRPRAGSPPIVLDAVEVMPPGPCPLCRQIEQRGHDRGWCWRCGGTGVLGDPLPQPGIRVDADGRAHVFKGVRRRGESVHRLHACAVAAFVRRAS